MRILFLPNWTVHHLDKDDASLQAPDKTVNGEPYWFFRYFPADTQVDVIDRGSNNWFRKIETRLKFYIRQPYKAFRVRRRYDIVISHGAQSGLVYELLASLGRGNTPPHLMFDIGGLNGARINHTETPLIRFALRKSPHIIVHASRQLEFYRRYYPGLARKARFIPFGADYHYFTPLTDIAAERQIITFGRGKRDFATLCDAFAAMPDKRGYRLMVVGDTSLMNRYTHVPEIKFTPGVPVSQLMQMIASSAFVAIPLPEYLYSYGQMSFLQSMSMAKPLIVTETTSSVDYISQAPGVKRVRTGDVDDMTQALQEMMRCTPTQLSAMGTANRQYIVEHFNERDMARGIYDYVQEIVEGGTD